MAFNVSLSLKGIGPHIDTKFDENVSSITMAIYAENGSGKSFISKSFKRISDLRFMESGNEDELKAKTSAMIRFGEDKGVMHFGITEPNKSSKSLDVVFEKDSLPQISDSTDWMYHVFNSEYVRENLESVKYKPEDNVSGFILGKVNIDLSKEKQLLENYTTNIEILKKSIEQNIEDGKKQLKGLRIQSNTSEFLRITYDNIKALNPTDENKEFGALEDKYKKLLDMPGDMDDVIVPQFPDRNQIKQLLTAISELLLKEYSLSNFAEEFKEKVKVKQDFIETGVQLSDGKTCPFCGQNYDDKASNLIDMYTAFLKDEEAKIINDIINKQKNIQNIIESFKKYVELNKTSVAQYDSIKMYFPSIENTKLFSIDIETLILTFGSVIKVLDEKKKNISKSDFEIDDAINKIETLISDISEAYQKNNNLIRILNGNKNDINKERLALRKALCNAKFNSIIDTSKKLFAEMNKLEENSLKLKKEIEEKESQAKIDRRKMLVNELKHYLTLFFADKYDFDEENFCISFQNKALVSNTDDVLSDGEKSILAFCFYLANIHGIVNKAEDYNRILFVIDDPVSSMDFNYVYTVAQVIRELKKHDQIDRTRYIILTHNMEFMSILVRNKIVSKKYILSHGNFTDFKNNYIMPYTYNLIDIYKESIGQGSHSHTIPNSIRHVLETMYRFEGSEGVNDNLEDYIASNDILKENSSIYSLINDHSHGAIRKNNGYTEEMLEKACQTVISFINSKVPGQIEEIKTILQER
ncbi:MAG: AAA family ATPase [Clostridia bacterium]|nr:AAA family ATPase [Clostridia bacterium]